MPGATRDQVRAAVEVIHGSLVLDRQPEDGAIRAEILPLTGRQNDAAGVASLLLAISVGSILLIGIANAAGLIVTRALARGHEIAIRASLGASRRRIVALLLTEALLIALAATGAGLLIARLALEGFRRAIPESVTRQMLGWEQLGLHGNVVAFAIALAVIAGLICGLVPAIGASRPNVALALQQNSAAVGSGLRGSRLLRALVTGEVALSVVLLLCAGLLTRSLLELVGWEPGFETEGVVTVRWNVPHGGDAAPGILLLQRELLERAAGVPGIASATLASDLPATKPGLGEARAYEIQDPGSGRDRGRAAWRAVTPGYLEALRVPLLQGRALAASDAAGAPRAAIISESLATRHGMGGGTALGRQISADGDL
jgi:putative ABC transport system permease protein